MNERFSAFLDDEATPRETRAVLKALAQDPQLRRHYSHQQWMRESLRAGSEISPPDSDFATRVLAGIEREAVEAHTKVVRMPKRRGWRAAAGLAATASLAAVVVWVGNPPDSAPQESAPLVQTASPLQEPQPVRQVQFKASPQQARRAADHWAVSDPAMEEQLNGYLLEHNGLARGYGLSRATPSFLRVATYGQRSE